MALSSTAVALVPLIVCSEDCGHQLDPDPAEMAARYGAETPVLDFGASDWSVLAAAAVQADVVASRGK
jgi:hypothetical protein